MMTPQFNHNLITSFALYLDHQLCDKAQAYINVSTGLYKSANAPAPGHHAWNSPFKSWVSDSCVGGAAIPSGVYNSSGQFLTRDSGIVFDFVNGRVISPHNWGPQLSGTFARKQFNVYTSTQGEVDWWMEQVFGENPSITYTSTGFSDNVFGAAPCIILTNSNEENAPWALGGVDNTKNTFVGYVISPSARNSNGFYLQEGVNSFVRDMAHKCFPVVSYADTPWNTSGELKSGYYCYDTTVAPYCPPQGYIENVYNTRINQRANKTTSFAVSVVEWDTSVVRVT